MLATPGRGHCLGGKQLIQPRLVHQEDSRGLGDGSVSKVLAVQAGGLAWNPCEPRHSAYDPPTHTPPSTGEIETGGSLWPADQIDSLHK